MERREYRLRNLDGLLRKGLCLFLVFCLSVFLTGTVFGEERRVIKVGYMNHPGFIEMNSSDNIVGYGAEYLEDIAAYTNWDIEYVLAPWVEQLEMLENGELDIVPLAQFSEERADKFVYSHQPVGILQCLLLELEDHGSDEYDLATYCMGKKIGVQKGSRNIYLFERYASNIGFTYELFEFDYQKDIENALQDKEVDMIICEQMVGFSEFHVVDRFASDPHYFITSKENPELMEEIDFIVSRINAYDPTYISKLYNKYYRKHGLDDHPFFTKEEEEFIRNSEPVMVSLVSGNDPYSFIDKEGNVTGIIPEIMQKVSDISGLKFEYTFVPYKVAPLMFIKEHPTYIASGVLANNIALESDSVLKSSVFYTSYSILAAKKGKRKEVQEGDTICTLSSFQAMQLFIQKNYPGTSILTFDTVEDCMKALAKGEVDYFAFTSASILPHLSNPLYADITIVDNEFMENPQCVIAMSSDTNQLIIDIIDKSFFMMPEGDLLKIEESYYLKNNYEFNQMDVWHRYENIIMAIGLALVSLFALLITFLFIRQKIYNKDITRHAEYDMMTGVYNRTTFKNKVTDANKSTNKLTVALLLIDIDDIKRINDTYGNIYGDVAVKSVANALKAQFRGNEFVARTGGDEFGVYIVDIQSQATLVPILNQLLLSISKVNILNKNIFFTISIGLAMGTTQDDPEELYRKASEAIDRVKKNGKNGFAFFESSKSISLASIDESIESREVLEVDATESPYNDFDEVYKGLLDSLPTVCVYVIERATHKVLYYNKRFNQLFPSVTINSSCKNKIYGICNNCILDSMGEQHMAHSVFYSEYFGNEVDVTATRIMFEGTDAVMISSWQKNMISSSSDKANSTTNIDSFDFVSGALTRNGFIHMMKNMQKGGVDLCSYAVLFINIKDFKAVNELIGSDGGDNVLRMLYARIERSSLHPIIGARKESDHFVFMVEKNNINFHVLPELLNFHYKYHGTDLFIHCRCGIFNIEDNNLEIYKMIDRAKLAKEHIVDDFVKPYMVYDKSMLEEYSENASAFLLFDQGIKNHEFVVFYQPIVDAKTGLVVSAEALVRRKTPDGTIVSPGKFIPILERTGYISMLDRFVATEVGKFINSRLRNHQKCVPVSFNISQKDFYDNDLMELLASSLESNTLPKGYVMIELTESAYTLNEHKHEEYLKKLREFGAKILLDDFGTGYSSFGMFKNYNFDRVKLDMSFVRRLTSDNNVCLVVESIITMCHKLGVQVVAEGVETIEELTILRNVGCDLIQGYYFSQPLDKKSFIKYLEEH